MAMRIRVYVFVVLVLSPARLPSIQKTFPLRMHCLPIMTSAKHP